MTEQEHRMPDHPTETESNSRIVLTIIQIFNLLTLIPWLIGVIIMNSVLYGVNIDTNPGEAAYDIIPQAVVTAIWWYPILPIGAFIGSVMLFRRAKAKQAMILASAPVAITIISSCSIFGLIFSYLP